MQTFTLVILILASACWVLAPRASADETAKDEPINQVFVTMEDERTLDIEFEPDEKLSDLKQRIEEHEGIPWQRQILSLGDGELRYNDMKLSDYSIKPGTSLELTSIYTEAETYVFVDPLFGPRFEVTVGLAQPVERLKALVTQKLRSIHEPHTNLRLILDGRSLRADQKLLAYPIKAGTALMQGKPLEDCRADAEIVVRTLSGATIKCQVDLADTVAELERSIAIQTGAPSEVQVLIYGKNRLRSEDHLCDHELESGAIVNLAFYSRRVRVPDDIDRLGLPWAKSPYEVPVFREANDSEADAGAGMRKDVLEDKQNWLFERKKFADVMELFNTIAPLELTPQELCQFERLRPDFLKYGPIGIYDDYDLYQTLLTRARMLSVVSRYPPRMMTTKNIINMYRHSGIQLGASWQPGEHLGTNINNYAPGVFSDDEIMGLFEKSEPIRRRLEEDARTGEGHLSLAKQKEMNHELLRAYRKALRGMPSIVGTLDNEQLDDSDCLICHDALAAEPAVMLPCGHKTHLDCVKEWARELHRRGQVATCPYCRKFFGLWVTCRTAY